MPGGSRATRRPTIRPAVAPSGDPRCRGERRPAPARVGFTGRGAEPPTSGLARRCPTASPIPTVVGATRANACRASPSTPAPDRRARDRCAPHRRAPEAHAPHTGHRCPHIEVELVPSVPEQATSDTSVLPSLKDGCGLWRDGRISGAGVDVGSESYAHHHRYTRRQVRGCPGRPASCLRSAPLAAQTGGVARGTRSDRPGLRRRTGGGIGQPVCFGNRSG